MKRERGQAFILVLILLAVGALLIVPFLQMVSTAIKSRQLYGQYINEDYAADAAIEYGMWRLKYETGFAASLPPGQECEPFYITLNGVTASTTVIAQAPPGQLSGQDLAGRAWDEPFKVDKTVIATTTYLTLAADGFESHSGSGGTGTWLGSWTLSGDYSFGTYGSYEGSYHLRLRGDDWGYPGDGYAQRAVDLSGSSGLGPFLNFCTRVESFESGDWAKVKVSTNGTDWDVLETYDYDDSDNQWHAHPPYDLSGYGTPPVFYLAFETNLSSSHDYFYIDAITFSNSQEATIIEPGVVTDYTYFVAIQCLDPAGCCYQEWWTHLGLDNIVDVLPERGASSGDYLQYIYGSTYWDEGEWGVPPFEPTNISGVGSGSSRHQELKWDFEDAYYNDICFDYGEIKTMSFQARAALTEGVYCNSVQAYVSSYWGWGWEDDLVAGSTAKITVGDPEETSCSGGLLTVEKVADPVIIYPNEETTVTYTITLQNVDTVPVKIYQIEDWLPSTGSEVPEESFVYVDDSAYGYIIGRDSLPVLFYDNFSRPDSYTVLYWVEDEGSSGDCRVYQDNATMRANGSITQPDISTIGSFGNVLSYQWVGKTTEITDTLRVEWKPSSSSEWNLLVEHPLNYNSSWQNANWDLPAGADDTSIDIRFTGITDQPNEYARLDNVKISCSNPADITPVCMPDENQWYYDFFYQYWDGGSRRWVLDWDFGNYPNQDDPVWSVGGSCSGDPYADYSPYLEIQPGEIFEMVFKAEVTLTASGSYYDEVFVRITEEGWGWWDNWLYSWPTGGVTVPQYDLQAETLHSVLRAAAMLSPDGYWWRSWHWWWHR